MAAEYNVVIVGAGPAGMSAAARAAKEGMKHVLLERAPHLNDTIFKYQKRKLVMATPEILPLRSDLEFKEELREEVVDSWETGLDTAKVNFRLNTEVTAITGQRGDFEITLGGGDKLSAEHVVLAIGVQGNIRRLTIPGADLPLVQYQLDDPEEYQGEEIVVIGTGDAGLENALGLSVNNLVTIINRGPDFPYAKPANAALVEAAINKGDIQALFNAEPKLIEPGYLVVETREGEARVKCDRIIARIGALPPRRFVESCGVKFASDSPTAFPPVSETYEAQVEGLYVIGALAGYPLIKNCLNQGYEVVEYILGNKIAPADEPLIQAKLEGPKVAMTVAELVTAVRERLPLFATLTPLQIREFLVRSELHQKQQGDVVIARGEFANSVYFILEGEVGVRSDAANPEVLARFGAGRFFGELALLSGQRRTATVVATAPSLLLEIDRNTMIRLLRSVPEVKQAIDSAAIVRQIKLQLLPAIEDQLLDDVVRTATVVDFKTNDVLIEEGATDNSVYLIQGGSVTVSVPLGGGKQIISAYIAAGQYVGEMAMVTNAPRSATIRAAVPTETIRIDGAAFRALLDRYPELQRQVQAKIRERRVERRLAQLGSGPGGVIEFFTNNGVIEATDALLIDEALCVRCDNCEKACAETHHGVSRLNREAGPTFATLHVPTSCRHCEDPHCMKDCPPDAIHRAPNGEVFIADNCIGCGNCERNCPYGVIQMAATPPEKPGLLRWLLFGAGHGPGEDKSPEAIAKRTGAKHAVKCDMCLDIDGGPACVRACPTGAAIRVSPDQFIHLVQQSGA